MTNRIMNEAGEYAPDLPVAPVEDAIDPETLPQIKPDPWVDVDIHDFSTAHEMDRGRILLMAQIAHDRNDPETAMAWKQVGLTQQKAEADAESAQRMNDILNQNKYVGTPGQILNTVSDLPHHRDEQWQQTRADLDTAKTKLEGMDPYDSDHTQQGTLVANLVTALADREVAVRQEALDAGVLTETDIRTQDAQASLQEKSAQMMRSAE